MYNGKEGDEDGDRSGKSGKSGKSNLEIVVGPSSGRTLSGYTKIHLEGQSMCLVPS